MIESQPVPPPLAVAPSPEVAARIRTQVMSSLGPARGASLRFRWFSGLLAVVAMLAGVYVVLAAAGHAPPASRAAGVATFGVAMIAVATFIGLGRGGSATVSIGARAAIAAAPPLAFLVIAWLTSAALPATHVQAGDGSHLGCLRNGALMATVPMVALLALWRRTDPFTPRLTGALIGGWAGLSGAVGLGLACPSIDTVHLLIGHGGAVLGGALIGTWLGRRWLAP